MRMHRYTKTERDDSIVVLREWLHPGDTVFTILRHVSNSGMHRSITLVKIEVQDGRPEPLFLDYHAVRAMGWRFDKHHDGVIIAGSGLDMGSHLVSILSATLFSGDRNALVQRWL